MISIRRYTNQDLDTVKEFFFKAFEGDIPRKIDAFSWIQTQNPFADRDNNYFLIFFNRKLVGYWGIMPMKCYHFGNPIQALFSHEALVDPTYRGRGLAAKLLREVNRSDRFLVSLWHNEKILSILEKEGWSNIGNFRPLRKIYKLENLIESKLRSRFLQKPLIQFSTLWLKMRSSPKKTTIEYKIEFMNKCGAEFDNFFMRVAPKLGIVSDRTSATLNWKYRDIPHKKYTLLTAMREGHMCGYTVLRVENQEKTIRKGTIVDLLADPDEPEPLSCLIDRCEEIFLNNGVDFSVCQVSLPIFRNIFKEKGYSETKIRPTDSLYIYNDEMSPDRDSVRDIRNWYFTYGESDADMW